MDVVWVWSVPAGGCLMNLSMSVSVPVCLCVCPSQSVLLCVYWPTQEASHREGMGDFTDILDRNVQGIEPLTPPDSDNNHHSLSTNMHKCAHHLWWIFTEILFNLCDGCFQQMEHMHGSGSGQGSNSLDSESWSHGKPKVSKLGGYIVLWNAG